MTEQPDTAKIRARYDWGVPAPYNTLCGLCDALDAARAERDDLRKAAEGDAGKWLTTTLMRDRAEVAEARLSSERGEWNAMLNEANERVEAAEARIAKALDIMDAEPHDVDLEVRRTLTRDTP